MIRRAVTCIVRLNKACCRTVEPSDSLTAAWKLQKTRQGGLALKDFRCLKSEIARDILGLELEGFSVVDKHIRTTYRRDRDTE